MENDITKVYDQYEEEIMFCKFCVAEKLNHHPEMGRCGENIVINSFKNRFSELRFVTGFVIANGEQSPQCDIMICKKNMHKRQLNDGPYLVDARDCLMIIEVKSNVTKDDLNSTIEKNSFFASKECTKHIKLALFAFKSRIGKKQIYHSFGYSYDRTIKGYVQKELGEEINIDYFICIHREKVFDDKVDKQVFFLKDSENGKRYICNNEMPIMRNFWNLIGAFQD